MLQAYADASTEHDELFVLAGYIAPTEKWAQFSDEWQAELDRSPNKLAVFKMKDQAKRHYRRAERFYRVIEKHVTMAVSERAWQAATYHSLAFGPISWCRKSLAFN